ncbi:MAG TPA: acyl-CoA dehydrogenase family protein [Chloroflexia bacterium]|nr:acyl-CoA dehydrogenase family protein [Chloroflexia bacterium]
MTHPMFTAEHEEMRKVIRKFVSTELAPHAAEWEEAGGFPSEVFRRMGELGFLGLTYPEEYCGSGGDYLYSVVLTEEMVNSECGGLNMGLGVHTDMVLPTILKFGTEEQKQKYVRKGVSGEWIGCLGITEPNTGSDVQSIRTWAKRDGDDYIINGSKLYITNGVRADFCLLVTKTEGERSPRAVTLFLVDKSLPGFTVSRKLKKVGMHSSDTAELSFDNVRVPASAILGEVGKGFYHLMWELQVERLFAAVGAVAAAQRAYDLAYAYAKERQAFGHTINEFQVIRHKFADMATQIEAGRQLTYSAVQKYMEGGYPVKEITMAKLFTAQMSNRVIDEALQIHGGAGYMDEYEVSRMWRDIRLNRVGAGTDEIMKEIIAKELGLL